MSNSSYRREEANTTQYPDSGDVIASGEISIYLFIPILPRPVLPISALCNDGSAVAGPHS